MIDNDGFELATVDAAVGIDVFHRPAYRLHLVEAEQGGRSGQWIGHAEFQRVLRLRTGHCAAEKRNSYCRSCDAVSGEAFPHSWLHHLQLPFASVAGAS